MLALQRATECAIFYTLSCRAGFFSDRSVLVINQQLPRRRFLRSAGVMLALPLLDSLLPKSVRAEESVSPRRMLLISNNLGVLPKPFFPQSTGRDYELSLPGRDPLRNNARLFRGRRFDATCFRVVSSSFPRTR